MKSLTSRVLEARKEFMLANPGVFPTRVYIGRAEADEMKPLLSDLFSISGILLYRYSAAVAGHAMGMDWFLTDEASELRVTDEQPVEQWTS